MSQMPLDPPPTSSGSVELDTPCKKCGYNLRGLQLDGRCPECGTPVGVSVNGDLLRYCEPGYVAKLGRGVSVILWGIIVTVFLSVGLVVLTRLHAVWLSSPAVILLNFFAGIPSVIGGWLLTTPDPSGLGEDQYGIARKIIRITLTAALLQSLINIVSSSFPMLPPWGHIALLTTARVVLVIGLTGTVAQLLYLQKLALRIPDIKLSKSASQIVWGLPISYGGLLLFGLLGQMLGRSTTRAYAGCASGLFLLGLVVYGLMYLFMLSSFGRKFNEQGNIARSIWGQSHH